MVLVALVAGIGMGAMGGDRSARAASWPALNSSLHLRPIPHIVPPHKLHRAPRDPFVAPRAGAVKTAVSLQSHGMSFWP